MAWSGIRRTVLAIRMRAAHPVHVCVLTVALTGVPRPAAASGDAVTFWNETAITSSAVHLGRAPAVSPIDLAYVHLAIYDVVVALRTGHQPFAVHVASAPADASLEAAIAAAAHRVLLTMFPSDQAYLDGRYATALSAVPDGAAKDDGVAVGEQVADGLITARAGDGWNAMVPYLPGSGPGVWQPTPPAFAAPVAPWVAVMRPFTFDSPSRFRAEPPPALDSAQWAEDYNEVQRVGSATSATRTAEQTDIGRFYGEHAGIQYARIFRDFADAQGLSVEDDARLFAMLYVTSADAMIGCWDSKYHYSFWRPVTAIRAGDTDGNALTSPDPSWTPLLPTPAHPEYPSAHGCYTASIAEALATFFGTKKVTITLTSTLVPTPRTFDSTDELIREIIDARIYAGIHYRTSVVHGAVLGRQVAHWVAKRYFQPVE
jgi:PAP2 superfamily protein